MTKEELYRLMADEDEDHWENFGEDYDEEDDENEEETLPGDEEELEENWD